MTNKRYKIGIFFGSLNGAGAEKTLLTLSQEFFQLGYEITLFTLKDGGDYKLPEGISRIVLEGSNKNRKKKSLSNYTKKEPLDIFITSKPEFYNFAYSKKKICTVHNTLTEWINIAKVNRVRKWLNHVKLSRRLRNKNLVALSNGIKQDLVENLNCKEELVQVISNPYDFSHINKMAMITDKMPTKPFIIYVASMVSRKRHEDLLVAYSKSEKLKHYQLVFVGKGELEQKLKNLAQELNIEEKVTFFGWTHNPYYLIKNASLSVLVSEAEGMPRSLVESMIIGTPVISTDCRSGPREVLTEPFSEFLVPVGDITAISQAMEKALESFPDLNHFQKNNFDSKLVAKQYIELFNRC